MIEAVELGDDQKLATRVLVAAISFAPGLGDLTGLDRDTAVLILQGVYEEATGRGSRFVRGERTMSSGVDYVTGSAATWFSAEDRAALVHLSNLAVTTAPGGPAGNFPTGYPVSRIWHEVYPDSDDPHYQDPLPRWWPTW